MISNHRVDPGLRLYPRRRIVEEAFAWRRELSSCQRLAARARVISVADEMPCLAAQVLGRNVHDPRRPNKATWEISDICNLLRPGL